MGYPEVPYRKQRALYPAEHVWMSVLPALFQRSRMQNNVRPENLFSPVPEIVIAVQGTDYRIDRATSPAQVSISFIV